MRRCTGPRTRQGRRRGEPRYPLPRQTKQGLARRRGEPRYPLPRQTKQGRARRRVTPGAPSAVKARTLGQAGGGGGEGPLPPAVGFRLT